MRWIAPSLVALSLVFSTGGVALVGRADSGTVAKPQAVQSRDAAQNAAEQCTVPTRPRNSASTRRKRTAIGTGKNTVVLNTSGYNYATDGQWKGSPMGPPEPIPSMTPVRPPAAPAPK